MEEKIIQDQKISGFYYDNQLNDISMRMSLHVNTMPDGKGDWIEHKGEADPAIPGSPLHLKKMTLPDPGTDVTNWSAAYCAKPLVCSIFNEDFQVEINNNWTDHDGGNALEGLFNTLKPYAPYAKELSNSIEQAKKEGGGKGSIAASFLGDIAEKIGQGAGTVSNLLNRGLIVQGTRFSYYSGTNTSFGNLSMKFTLFSDWKENGEFETVNEKIDKIKPYVVGEYAPYSGEFGETKGGDLNKFLGKYVGWQKAPGGFNSDVKNIDTCQKGTMRLVLGGYYSIENLVCRSMSINMSKIMAKAPSKDGTNDGKLTPLYADIVLGFQPASIFTDKALSKFMNRDGMGDFIYSQEQKSKMELEKEFQKNYEGMGNMWKT